MNKRAAVSEHAILNIIMGIIVAIGLVIIFSLLFRAFFGGGGEYRTAEVNLNSLSQATKQLIVSPNKFEAIRNYPLFVQENGFIIVAFNSDDDVIKSGCYSEEATRPQQCLKGMSCLCLYEDVNLVYDFDSHITANPPQACAQLPDNVVFIAPDNALEEGGDADKKWNFGVSNGAPSVLTANSVPELQANLPQSYSYENLLIYGQCDNMVWNSQKVYIEKFEGRDGKIYVYIARESPITEMRYLALKKAFP